MVNTKPRILYLVHDLDDPAVRRRVLMLQAGGAAISLAGFRRPGKPSLPMNVPVIDLGVTYDGQMAQRVSAVARACFRARHIFASCPKPDVILARNLETLAVAKALRSQFGGHEIPVVYEALDIHRLLLRRDIIGSGLRKIERWLSRDISLLVTSSPAFVRNYFAVHQTVSAPVAYVENKHLDLHGSVETAERIDIAPPWQIGWFGAIRCARSLELLSGLAGKDRYRVTIRGIPSPASVPHLEEHVARHPGLVFLGPYRNPEDIAAIYASVHFSWAIDLYEEGANSEWLLPNRVYEGCRFGAVPIALARTETGRFLKDRGIGLLLDEPSIACLRAAMDPLDAASVKKLRNAVAGSPSSSWVASEHDCKLLVKRLAGLSSAGTFNLSPLQEMLP